MKTRAFLCFYLILIISGSSIFAQKSKITIFGTVLDLEGTPIENAIILIDNKKTKVLTDEDGNFEIKVKPEAIKIAVVVFGTGMIEEEIAAREQIDFIFQAISPDQQEYKEVNLDNPELVNTGYNKVRREHVVTSIYRLDVAKSNKKYSSLHDILLQTPGLIYRNNQFIISGAGGGCPIWVVDGIPLAFIPDLSPSQIASVEVLKGTAAAIYGSRGFGGAVIITTRIP